MTSMSLHIYQVGSSVTQIILITLALAERFHKINDEIFLIKKSIAILK